MLGHEGSIRTVCGLENDLSNHRCWLKAYPSNTKSALNMQAFFSSLDIILLYKWKLFAFKMCSFSVCFDPSL